MNRSMTIPPEVTRIRILPADVISRIAAGEVVERPAAVVKELIDNSLDAGSTRIAVEVADGGRVLIRVTDDGEGMGRHDAELAFERHATSKVRSEKDLWSVTTMGFRGEALPSIASVARVRMVTARRGEPVGLQLVLAGGAPSRLEEAVAVPGTQIEVADLFFNTPARRKFLKTTATEFSHICQVIQQAALAWPGTQYSLRHNGQEVLDYPAASSLRDRVLQIYGPRCLERMVEVTAARPGVRVAGYAVSALHTRSTRSPQDLFVNRRPVRNATISHAIYEGYGAFLVKGRHPAFVLQMEVDPERVDVNVHPTKREVRFSDQEMIHQVVRHAIRNAVGGAPSEPAPGDPVLAGARSGEGPPARPQWPGWTAPAAQGSLLSSVAPRSGSANGADRTAPPAVYEPVAAYAAESGSEVRPLGQVRRTFLVALVGAELQVIDQHTAHERVLFERLCRAWGSRQVASQPLLIPEPFDLPAHSAALLHRYAEDLEPLGLQIEAFGGNSFLVRAVPALLGHMDHASLVQDLTDDLSQWDSVASLEQRVRPLLASLACHGAVRAGREMELPEIGRLIEDWVAEGFPMTCPHGRRVALRLPEDELARIFGRA
jgi:DNA mismatch repair protein MutL